MKPRFEKECEGIYRLRIPLETVYTSVFLVKTDRGAFLVDAATTDADVNGIILPALAEMGYTLSDVRGLVLTHRHNDHAGGSRHLLSLRPDLEVIANERTLADGVRTYPLPGHTEDQYGFATDDGAVYLADALASRATLEKYGIPYVYDVGIYLETLERIAAMQGARFVSAHSEMTEDIAPLARENIRKTEELISVILEEVSEPIAFEGLLERIFSRYGLVMSLEQYLLVGSTLRSYLTYLSEVEKITHTVKDRMLCWVKREEREE